MEDKKSPLILTKKKKRTAKEDRYIDSQEFSDKLKQYYEDSDEEGKNYRDLTEMLLLIANRLSSSACFVRYTWKDDMIGEALLKMVKALNNKKYSFEYIDKGDKKSTPFSYFTKIAYWAFVSHINAEKKQAEIYKQYRDEKYTELITSGELCSVYVKPDYDNDYDND